MKALVIGGGIIGNAIAWRLAGEDVHVTVFERGRLGQEASWAAAGMLAPQAEADAPGPFFELCVRGREAFEAILERLVRESGIDPEYDLQGVLYVALDDQERAELEARARWQRKEGVEVEELSGTEALKVEPLLSPKVVYALHLPTNRRVDNRKLTQAYAVAAAQAGARFREGCRVDAIIMRNAAAAVRTRDGAVHDADVIVNAAGAWAGEIAGLERDAIRLKPIRGQILCFETRPGTLGPAVFSKRGYLVPRRDGRLLAGSTMDDAGFDKSVTLAGMDRIVRGAGDMIPSLASTAFREAWAGFRPAADDLLPIIGPSPNAPNVLYATGHFRSGILLSAVTAELVADLVKGRKPPIDLAPFSPARFGRSRNDQ
jgi:glycine oxidase